IKHIYAYVCSKRHCCDLTFSRIAAFLFFNNPATSEIYTLSLHDALPISRAGPPLERLPRDGRHRVVRELQADLLEVEVHGRRGGDRKSTRLNSSHVSISYAVFCLKKKKKLLDAPACTGLHPIDITRSPDA